uniref:Uncharacterized protein n=1 Tax=Tanacetum cinerariifolium TaxID=118510 RepID=A0A6L2LKS9_TANCI|nr:hypothetical protein [Tanacetum cinerariifolium]
MTFKQYKDAKSLFVAIQTRFGGNEATKKTQKTLLKQMYENFSALSTESLDSILIGFRRLNKSDLDTMSIDDLYNNFKIVEQEVRGTTSSNSSSQNMAFVSSPSSTNEVNTAYGVSIASTSVNTASTEVSTAKLSDATVNPPKAMVAIDGVGFDWSYMAEDEVPTNMALMAFSYSECNAIAYEPNPPINDSEARPLKDYLIKFSAMNNKKPLILNYKNFVESTELDYAKGSDYIDDESFGSSTILSNLNFSKNPSKVTLAELTAFMVAINKNEVSDCTFKTMSLHEGLYRDKDSEEFKPPADIKSLTTHIADLSGTDSKYLVDQTQFTRLRKLYNLTNDEIQEYLNKKEEIKKKAEQARLLEMTKSEIIKVVYEEAKKTRIDLKTILSYKGGEQFKKIHDAEHQVLKREHSQKAKKAIDLRKKRLKQNFQVHNPFKFVDFRVTELDELSPIILKKMNKIVGELMISLGKSYERLGKIFEELRIQSALVPPAPEQASS